MEPYGQKGVDGGSKWRVGTMETDDNSPRGKNQVSFRLAIGNTELVRECFPNRLGVGTARII